MSCIINQSNINVNGKQLKIVFLGTPEFAVPILENLIKSEFKPVTIFCAPDKPTGRKQLLTPPPVKIAARKYNIPVFQPSNKSELQMLTSKVKPDLIISAAYGLVLPKEVLDAPRYGCLNIHPSILPKYRGASPIQAAILNDDEETGATIIKMDEKIDHGPMIANRKWQMANSKYTTPELSKNLSEIGANLLLDILPDWIAGKILLRPQDESQASVTKQIKKEDGLIDWKKSAKEIERQIRAYKPWPGTYARFKDYKPKIASLKILGAEISEFSGKTIGEIFVDKQNKLCVQTGKDALIIKRLQLEGGKPVAAQDFIRGHQNLIGQILA